MKREEGTELLETMKKEQPQFDDLPLDGWLWEIVRRDEVYQRRFAEIEKDVEEYNASRLSLEDYRRKLKSFRAHLRRYGLDVSILAGIAAAERLEKSSSYLLVPFPGDTKCFAVPRPEIRYKDLATGKIKRLSRREIRDLLAKYNLLIKNAGQKADRGDRLQNSQGQLPCRKKEAAS